MGFGEFDAEGTGSRIWDDPRRLHAIQALLG